MKVLLTGATGFIGPYVARALVANRHEVRAIVRPMSDLSPLKLIPLEFWRGDVTDPVSLLGACDDIETLVHLVGILKEKGPATFKNIHVEGTRNVLKNPPHHVIFVSAVGARPDPHYPYFDTKYQAEQLVKSSGKHWTILRATTVFGRGDDFLTRFAEIAKHPLSPIVPIIGSGRNLFQPIWVEDLARCVVKAVEDPDLRDNTYEVGGPDRYTYDQLMDEVMRAADVQKLKVHIPILLARPGVSVMSRILPNPPLTPGQLAMLQQDNVAEPNVIESAFGIKPSCIADKLDYL